MLKHILCAVLFMFAAGTAPAKAAGGAPILVLGDSLSSAHRIAPEAGWVHLLEQRLNAAGNPRPIVNASISGETTSGGLARLPKLLADEKPALVIVELGANDGLRGLPIAEIQTNLEKILAANHDAGARSVLLGIELPINYGPQYRDGLRQMYRDLAGKFNAPLLPFLLDGVALNPALMQDDGLHPKAEGEPRVLDNVWSVLEPALGAHGAKGWKGALKPVPIRSGQDESVPERVERYGSNPSAKTRSGEAIAVNRRPRELARS